MEPTPYSDKEKRLREVLRDGIKQGYEKAFERFPRRAEAARQNAELVIGRLLQEIQNSGFLNIKELDGTGLDVDDLRCAIEWGSFDYSVERGGEVQTVDHQTFLAPLFRTIVNTEGYWENVAPDFKGQITSMRLVRHQKGVIEGSVDEAFVADYIEATGQNPID